MTSNLKWSTHIGKIVSKANTMLGLLRRTCPLLKDRNTRRTLYLSLLKSQLFYATEIRFLAQSSYFNEVDTPDKER